MSVIILEITCRGEVTYLVAFELASYLLQELELVLLHVNANDLNLK